MTTNVPGVTFGPNGFQAPLESAILAGVQADIQAAFGGLLNSQASSPQGQLSSSFASIIGDSDATFLYQSTQTDPAFATGRWQDAIARIYFLTRNPSQPTVLQVSCNGAQGVPIPVGALVNDPAGNTYSCTGSGVIPLTGAITLQFANVLPGPIAVPQSVQIAQTIPGWDSVTLISGVVGNNVESRSAFETRRQNTVASNSAGSVSAIRGAVLKVPGVIDAYVTENAVNGTLTVGGTSLGPNSIYVAVVGGLDTDVAQAIWSKKAPGCAYNGNTTAVVQDSSSGYSPPLPSYNVTFYRPPNLQVLFQVNIVLSAAVPADATQQIQNALLSAFIGGDGGPRAQIGNTLLATRYVAPIIALGAWAQVKQISLGSINTPIAVCTGSITGNTFVTGTVSGTLSTGQTLASVPGLAGSGVISPGCQITGQVSGTPGGAGTYTVNNPQNAPLQTIIVAQANAASVQVNINQEPVLSAGNISVVVSP